MGVSGQPNIPAALLPEKEPLLHTGYEVRWAPEAGRMTWRTEKYLSLLGFEPLIIQPVTQPLH